MIMMMINQLYSKQVAAMHTHYLYDSAIDLHSVHRSNSTLCITLAAEVDDREPSRLTIHVGQQVASHWMEVIEVCDQVFFTQAPRDVAYEHRHEIAVFLLVPHALVVAVHSDVHGTTIKLSQIELPYCTLS